MRNCLLTVSILTLFHLILVAQKPAAEDRWVDSVYQTMNDTERIGQMIMIRAHSNLGSDHIAEVEYLIKKYAVGSLCFFQGTFRHSRAR